MGLLLIPMKTDWNMDARDKPLLVWQFAMVLALCLTAFDSASAGALERLFAPKAVPWSYWDTRQAASTLKVDHSRWDAFLRSYVQTDADGINRVPYARVRAEDRTALQVYIEALSQLPIRQYSRSEQLAYWINLYNAVTRWRWRSSTTSRIACSAACAPTPATYDRSTRTSRSRKGG